MTKRRVVITGLGAITSLGIGIEKNWDGLLNGRCGIRNITFFDTEGFTSKVAGEVRDFDPMDYFPKPEARKMDRFTQLAVVGSDEAIKDSGLDLDRVDRERFACIFGTGIGGIKEMEDQKHILDNRGPTRITPFLIPKMMPNAISGVVSIKFGLMGTNFVASSACASAAHAMGLAFRSIQYGDSDLVVTGGSEATVTPLSMAGFCSLKALSTRNDDPERSSRPFDKERDGFVLGEGSGVLIFEEYEHAVKRGADIYAEVKGFAATADAYHITAPKEDGEGPARAMRLALKDADVAIEDIQYVNAHGTSTPYNDAIETTAIKKAFGAHAEKLAISSTKSMIGHLLGGSAAAELAFTAMSIKNGVVHPTINQETPDPACDLDYVPNKARDLKITYAVKNSLGFGGHNACLVLGAV